MTASIKPIETIYKGYRFRSRLEARWAVFFDALGVPFEYETEGFDLGDPGWYLPDFWLSQQECWIEIKPGEADIAAQRKCEFLANQSGFDVFMFQGGSFEPVGSLDDGKTLTGTTAQHWHPKNKWFSKKAAWAECVRHQGVFGIHAEPFTPKFWKEHAQEMHFDDYQSMKGWGVDPSTRKLTAAYMAARAARFERH